ncbi:UvrABC system protein C [Pilimelia terevasa]|uniref:UvrABC system protein C n=1 Tax=Pilimelia terevasa TaxID=53372 RepID=A0A8J3FJI5_9ACTN|nr:excinuclease ABC subunit UvrC [Pilimelia terevasa]GGK23848.1 UvrABC system protein C [Pilimelia terevasa]
MADPATYRPPTGTIPEAPGVYRFHDARDRVIYVGKAVNLRGRLNSYFADLAGLHPRTQQMVTSATRVDWVTVASEVEALQLEYTWIKEHDPRFNVRYRDDKSYPYLAVTLHEEYPRLQVMRGEKKPGVRYFGPYSHAWAIRETLDLLLRVFPARTCSAGVFRRMRQIGRPCLLGDIGKCAAPCVGRVDAAAHRKVVDDFVDFMAGRTQGLQRRLEREMHAASDALEFERAARLRDDLAALRRALAKQAVVLPDGTDADVVAFADDPLQAAVQVFHVRGGRVRGQRGWAVEKTEDLSTGDLVHHFCSQVYGGGSGEGDVPRELLVPELPGDAAALADWLSAHRGSRVRLRVPQRGPKRDLMETVARNAGQVLAQYKLRRVGDLAARGQALDELAEALGMDSAPLRIECVDVSQLHGTDVVASLVVFEDGAPRKSDYRTFAIRGDRGVDDLAALGEVVRRRFARADAAPADTSADPLADASAGGGGPAPGGRPRRFAYPPQLFVVDGGQPQVNAVAAALAGRGVSDLTVVGLAKRMEELWLPGESFPVILPRQSAGLFLLQHIRDQAHDVAIRFHRKRRSRRMTESALDEVAGLGEARRKALLRHFGSLQRVSAADVAEIMEVPGIGRRTAEAVIAALRPGEPATPAPVAPAAPAGPAAQRDAADAQRPTAPLGR